MARDPVCGMKVNRITALRHEFQDKVFVFRSEGPGMAIGSPGMEQGDRVDPHEVILFGDDAPPSMFATHRPVTQ